MIAFGPYTVISTLGEGGMATVYLATDPKHGRTVAIKVMKPDLAAAIGADRFLREIETVARLTHPHILPLYDSGSADGQLYYVMPHIQGGSLRGRLTQEPRLPLDEAVRLTHGIASALGYAHQKGLVHRDVKPENVLLSDGIPLVADFGLARSSNVALDSVAETQAGTERLTGAHVLLGTPAYMAPEQALGDQPLDGRADLYALGCMLYEMLSGRRAFEGPSISRLLMRHATEAVPSLREARTDIPDAVSAVIARSMAKTPADRFATAAEMMAALNAAVTGRATGAIAAPSGDVRIAVLPFQALGGSPDDTALSDGICDELIYVLGRISGVRVIARGSSFLFRERRADVRAIGTQLQVGLILDGSVRRAGNRLRLTAELINTADGFQRWSERYDREIGDVFALQDDIAGAIASVLREQLGGSGRAAAPDAEASEHYLAGLQHWNRRTPRDLETALAQFTAAVRRDGRFADAWGAAALCHVTLGLYGLRAPGEAMRAAQSAADSALTINRRQAAALTARACVRAVYDWDPEGAERDFKAVIAAAPSDVTAHQWYATNLLAPLGRFEEARAELAAAHDLDPLSPSVAVSEGLVVYLAGDLPSAIAQCERALELDPTFSAARYFLGPMLAAAGRPQEAIASLDTAAAATDRSPEVIAALATACAEAGERGRAEAILGELERASASRYVSPALTAMVRAALGEVDEAIGDMTRAIEARAVEAIWLDMRPSFARIRSDARYAALRAQREAARRLSTPTLGA